MTPTTPDLGDLLGDLDERQHRLAELDAYYHGRQPLAFTTPEARDALGDRFGRLAVNIPRLAVTALAERLRVTGLTVDGQADPRLWAAWKANRLHCDAPAGHRGALALGRSFVSVWARSDGSPLATVESARQVTVALDAGTGTVLAAVKRWETKTTTEVVHYLPDEIIRHRAATVGATIGGLRVVERLPNPFGIVPIVPMFNSDRGLSDGVSEMADLLPLVDALNKLVTDMLVGSEFYARPRRWATGVELEEDDDGTEVSPFPETDRMMISEAPEAKFGSLPAADLAAYRHGVDVIVQQMMAVSALPAHYMGITTANPPNADAIRSSEASLTARAEDRQLSFTSTWSQVGALMLAVLKGVDPATADVGVTWADPSIRSIAQEADAVVKLVQAGVLPVSYALARLGYTDEEIAAIRAARRVDALDASAVDLDSLLP